MTEFTLEDPPLEPGFALILQRGSPRPLPEIARILAYHLSLHLTDALTRVRYGGGLLAESVPESLAPTSRF